MRRWRAGSNLGESSLDQRSRALASQDPRYIARDKPAAAFNVVKAIYARTQILEQFPKSGQSYRTKGRREARILMWGHYRIVYIQPTESEVHIVGVFHGAMELDRYLK